MAHVLDVGNCDPDHGMIRRMLINNFDVDVSRVMFVEEAEVELARGRFDLVLVSRRIFADDSDGSELIRNMRRDPRLAATPVMLVSNFRDAQERAVADGAEHGFGKAAIHDSETVKLLSKYLPLRAPAERRAENTSR